MKSSVLSVSAIVLVVLAILAQVVRNGLLEEYARDRTVTWMNLEAMALACFALALLGCVLGWCAFERRLGKLSAILGTVLAAGFFYQLVRHEEVPSMNYSLFMGSVALSELAEKGPAHFRALAKEIESGKYLSEMVDGHPEYEPIRDVVDGLQIRCHENGAIIVKNRKVNVTGRQRGRLFERFRQDLFEKWNTMCRKAIDEYNRLQDQGRVTSPLKT